MRFLRSLYQTPVLAFFSHTDSRRYDFMRICFALASLINIIDMWEIRHTFFSDQGILIHYPKRHFTITSYSLFYLDGAQGFAGVTLIFLLSGFFCILLLLGLFPWISAFAVYLWTISYVNHIPPAACGYEMILQTFALIILISPKTGTWSLSWILFKRKSKPQFCPLSPAYGLILMQWQVAVIYWATSFYKVVNVHWQKGETVYYFITSFYGRFTPDQVWPYHELVFLLSDATLAIEFSLPLLLWNRKTRWLGLLLGIGFHTSIGALSRLSIFSIVMLSTYSCFIERDDLKRIRLFGK